MVTKSVICVVCAVILVLINTIILIMKPEFNYAINDNENYCVYYQKWISVVVFMSTIISGIISIYSSLNFKYFLAISVMSIECALVILYALVKYKGITIKGNEIKVQRLFRKEINTNFDNILNVQYIPNARLQIKIKGKKQFDVSFNSENFHKFYKSLLAKDVKFKTGRIPKDLNQVYITKYNISMIFPKTMFREYYQNPYYFRNSNYLFSARSLVNKEYIEAYYKESDKDIKDFIKIVKNDLFINNFNVLDTSKETIDIYEFTLIKSVNINNKKLHRTAYIYKDIDNYFVIYADYLKKHENDFYEKMRKAIRRSKYEDNKSKLVRV